MTQPINHPWFRVFIWIWIASVVSQYYFMIHKFEALNVCRAQTEKTAALMQGLKP